MSTTTLAGFADPIHGAQRTFRAALAAMSRPTLPQTLDPVATSTVHTPASLSPGVGALLLALCDEQTPLWLDAGLRVDDEVATWLRFHTAARIVDEPGDALFVVASSPDRVPPLHRLSLGTDEAPHQSATLVIDATTANTRRPVTVTGPGVNGQAKWDGHGLPEGFLAQWQENRARFPRGIDVFIVDGAVLRALPRTTALIASREQES